jgi:hypothetical protein
MKWKISFNKSSLDLLNTDLSHIEFTVVEDKKIKILQRDIYSGTIIELSRKDLESEGLGLIEIGDTLPEKMNSIGIRTGDFLSLFNFNDKVEIYFPPSGEYFIIEGAHNQMSAIISGCLYDDIGSIKDLQEEKIDTPILRKRIV